MIAYSEMVAINIQKGNEYTYLIEKIRNKAEEIDSIIQKYSN